MLAKPETKPLLEPKLMKLHSTGCTGYGHSMQLIITHSLTHTHTLAHAGRLAGRHGDILWKLML